MLNLHMRHMVLVRDAAREPLPRVFSMEPIGLGLKNKQTSLRGLQSVSELKKHPKGLRPLQRLKWLRRLLRALQSLWLLKPKNLLIY